jgi:hypothetical protein
LFLLWRSQLTKRFAKQEKQGRRMMSYLVSERSRSGTHWPHHSRSEGRLRRPGPQTDPAELAEVLRGLAVRAHDALKAFQTRCDECSREELHSLRNAIHWLENELRAQGLERMLPYVASLRRQVECALA